MIHGTKRKPMEDLRHSSVRGAVEVQSNFICAALKCNLESPRSSDQGLCTTEACLTRGMQLKPLEDVCHSFVTGAVEV